MPRRSSSTARTPTRSWRTSRSSSATGRSARRSASFPGAAAAYVSTREARVAILSSLGSLDRRGHRRHVRRRRARARRAAFPAGPGTTSPSGPAAPTDRRPSSRFALLLLGLPIFIGLGPVWLLLYWGALLYPYTEGRERDGPGGGVRGSGAGSASAGQDHGRQHRGTLAALRGRARPRGAPRRRERRGRAAPGGGRVSRGLRRLVPARDLRRALRRPRARPVRLRPGDAGRSGGLPPPPEPRQRAVHGGRLRRGHSRLHRGGQARPRIRGGLLQPLPRPRRGLRLRRPGRRDRARPARSRTPRSTAGSTTRPFRASSPPATRWTGHGSAWARGTPSPRAGGCRATAAPEAGGSTFRPGRSPRSRRWRWESLLARRRDRDVALDCDRCGRAVLQALPPLGRSLAVLRARAGSST